MQNYYDHNREAESDQPARLRRLTSCESQLLLEEQEEGGEKLASQQKQMGGYPWCL